MAWPDLEAASTTPFAGAALGPCAQVVWVAHVGPTVPPGRPRRPPPVAGDRRFETVAVDAPLVSDGRLETLGMDAPVVSDGRLESLATDAVGPDA